jgi:hypothetical protein
MSCSNSKDCVTLNDKKEIIGNKCNDPNNNCICVGGSCVSGSCENDDYCKSTFGDTSSCVNGSCTSNTCDTTDDCPPFMQCNGGICQSIACSGKGDCGLFGQCVDGYCTRMVIPSPFWTLILVILAVVAAVIGYKVYGKYIKDKW